MRKPCGCREDIEGLGSMLCTQHWNEMMIRLKLQDCKTWEAHGRLDPNDDCDAVVLRFYEHLIYWAARGAASAGGVVKF